MFISKLKVFNYKSYLDSGVIEFTPGINIIVGQNNSGKTSLLEALTLNFDNQPHLSLETLPDKSSIIKEQSIIEVYLTLEKKELRSFIQQSTSPVGIHASPEIYFNDEDNPRERHEISLRHNFEIFRDFLDNPEPIEIKLSIAPAFKIDNSSLENLLTFNHRLSYLPNSSLEEYKDIFYQLKYDINKKLNLDINHSGFEYDDGTYNYYEADINGSIGFKIINYFVQKIYRFKAERLIIGSCSFQNNPELKSDMSNLAEVLSILQGGNPERFRRFNDSVSSILPQIKAVSVRQKDDSIVEIMIWTIDPKSERDDLSFPLESCGTGVSQVLVILCILITSEDPRTIIIDEPQSFLHPGAAKKLIETLKQFPQHQYIIATHSPEIIASANPSTIIKLQYQDCQTTASVINTKEIESQNEILTELGVRLSDVFGADNILWVEGQTEEKCFPLILEKVANRQLNGTKILAVKNTGDLEGTRAKIIFDIYNKLSEGANLFPPAIGFLLDSEKKTEENKQVLREISTKPVEFLSRRMYENYLLDAQAISEIINEEATWLETPIRLTQVQEYLDKIKQVEQEKSYLPQGGKREEVSDNNWLSKIHGAKILSSIFQEFGENKLEFRKTKHSKKLTEWLVENKPDFLSELAKELGNFLHKSQ